MVVLAVSDSRLYSRASFLPTFTRLLALVSKVGWAGLAITSQSTQISLCPKCVVVYGKLGPLYIYIAVCLFTESPCTRADPPALAEKVSRSQTSSELSSTG